MVSCSIDEPILLLNIMIHGAHTVNQDIRQQYKFFKNNTRGWRTAHSIYDYSSSVLNSHLTLAFSIPGTRVVGALVGHCQKSCFVQLCIINKKKSNYSLKKIGVVRRIYEPVLFHINLPYCLLSLHQSHV